MLLKQVIKNEEIRGIFILEAKFYNHLTKSIPHHKLALHDNTDFVKFLNALSSISITHIQALQI